MWRSYEDMEYLARPTLPVLLEAYSGVAIVGWWNQIKFQLARMIEEQESTRNDDYARLLRGFLNTWEANPMTGSINRETLELLKAAADPLAKLDWNPASYFQGVYTSLDRLIADQEQLPAGVPTDQNDEFMGGAGSSLPPVGDEFGPTDDKPLDDLANDDLGADPNKPKPEGAPASDDSDNEIPIK